MGFGQELKSIIEKHFLRKVEGYGVNEKRGMGNKRRKYRRRKNAGLKGGDGIHTNCDDKGNYLILQYFT